MNIKLILTIMLAIYDLYDIMDEHKIDFDHYVGNLWSIWHNGVNIKLILTIMLAIYVLYEIYDFGHYNGINGVNIKLILTIMLAIYDLYDIMEWT